YRVRAVVRDVAHHFALGVVRATMNTCLGVYRDAIRARFRWSLGEARMGGKERRTIELSSEIDTFRRYSILLRNQIPESATQHGDQPRVKASPSRSLVLQ